MGKASYASLAPAGKKEHTLTKEQVLSELCQLEKFLNSCEEFEKFIQNIKYDKHDCQVAVNTSIRERKICTIKARLDDLKFSVSETIEQVRRDNKKLIGEP